MWEAPTHQKKEKKRREPERNNDEEKRTRETTEAKFQSIFIFWEQSKDIFWKSSTIWTRELVDYFSGSLFPKGKETK